MRRWPVVLCLLGLWAALSACGQRPRTYTPTPAVADALPLTVPALPTDQAIKATSSPTVAPPIEPPAPTAIPPATSATPIATAAQQESSPKTPASLPLYQLDAALDYYGHALNVKQETVMVNDSSRPWTEVVFNVSPAYWPGRFELVESTLIHRAKDGPAPVRWDNTMLHVPLEPALLPGERVEIAFAFKLNLPQLDAVGWAPDGNAGWGPRVTQVGDWHPALVPFSEEGGWQVWQYHPVGDPVRSRLADYELSVSGPPEVTVVAPGLIRRGEGQSQFRLRAARAMAFLASPDYLLFEDENGATPIHVFVLPESAASATVVLDTARQAIALFSDYYGSYPYEELIIAQNGFLTAMEYSALISLSGFAFDTYQGSPDALLVAITAHEVAHQWFYSSVGSDQVTAPWLDESLAMVSEWLFYEAYYPDLLPWWWRFRVDRWQPQGPVDVTIYEFGDSPTYVHNMYGRAAHFMRELRLLLGEDAFVACLNEYYRRHQQGWATADSFFAVVSPYTTPEALRGLASQYFHTLPSSLRSGPAASEADG